MNADTVDSAHLADTLGALRQELARLSARVAALETALSAAPHVAAPAPAPAAPAPAPPARAEPLSEELMLVLGAAVAAFLGEKPHIHQIHLLGTAAWAQQGRVTIQASHALSVHHHG